MYIYICIRLEIFYTFLFIYTLATSWIIWVILIAHVEKMLLLSLKKRKQEFSLWEEKSVMQNKNDLLSIFRGEKSNLFAPHRNSDPWNHLAYGSPPGKSLLTNLLRRLVFCSSFKENWWGISTDEACLLLKLLKLKTASHDPTLHLLLVP